MRVIFTKDYQTSFNGVDVVYMKDGDSIELPNDKAQKYIDLEVAQSAKPEELRETKIELPKETKPSKPIKGKK